MKRNTLKETQRILDVIAKRDLSDDGKFVYIEINEKVLRFSFHIDKKQLIDETVDNFNNYINPGFLKYRKSFSPDYVAGKLIGVLIPNIILLLFL